ncbi:MAG: hypothetical protein LBT86_09600 [Deltaproteobacteria bacterium]|jgi:hypothetical protein|nr:hypothetical protein [Deltaproteobacteria bacterium]
MILNKDDYLVKTSDEVIKSNRFKNREEILDSLSKGLVYARDIKTGIEMIPTNLLVKDSLRFRKRNLFYVLINGFKTNTEYSVGFDSEYINYIYGLIINISTLHELSPINASILSGFSTIEESILHEFSTIQCSLLP